MKIRAVQKYFTSRVENLLKERQSTDSGIRLLARETRSGYRGIAIVSRLSVRPSVCNVVES